MTAVTPNIDLSAFNDAYRKAESNALHVPDGTYSAEIESAELTTARTSGNPLLKYRLRVLSGDHSGKTLFKNRAITEKTISYVKDELDTLGIRLDKFSDLSAHLPALEGNRVEILIRSNGMDSNIYFQRASRSNSLIGDDDLPF
jgi:hypothetical protein